MNVALAAVPVCSLAVGLALGAVRLDDADPAPRSAAEPLRAGRPRSIDALAFGPREILFLADSVAGAVFAARIEPGTTTRQDAPFRLWDLEGRIAERFGIDEETVRVVDLAVHPTSGEAVVATYMGRGDDAAPGLLRVTADGVIEPIDLAGLAFARADLRAPAEDGVRFHLTDITFFDGEVYVAGPASNAAGSALRRLGFPFDSTNRRMRIAADVSSYPGESVVPRATAFLRLEGRLHLLAAPECGPLVAVPLDALKSGVPTPASAVASLGDCEGPLDLLTFAVDGPDGSADLLLVTSARGPAQVFSVPEIAQASARAYLSVAGDGLPRATGRPVPISGLLHVANQDEARLLVLRRGEATGRTDLISLRKDSYFRAAARDGEPAPYGRPIAGPPSGTRVASTAAGAVR